MVLAVTAVSDIVHVVAGFLAEQPGALGAGHMEGLLAPSAVTRHAGAGWGPALTPLLLTQVARLEVSVGRHQAQHDRLHGGHVSEPDLRNVEGADNVGPTVCVSSLQGPIFVRAELASLDDWNKSFGKSSFAYEQELSAMATRQSSIVFKNARKCQLN